MSADEELRAAVERVSESTVSVDDWWSRRVPLLSWAPLAVAIAFSGALLAAGADPDCFMPDGDPRAADRWADDGGRA